MRYLPDHNGSHSHVMYAIATDNNGFLPLQHGVVSLNVDIYEKWSRVNIPTIKGVLSSSQSGLLGMVSPNN